MGEIQWIKLSTDFFSDRKIRQIRALPDGDAMLLIWINLLVLAGQVNDGGMVYLTQGIPYTEEMLAEEMSRGLPLVRSSLSVFRKLNMIEDTPDGLLISNWEKHQNIDGMERAREKTRERVRKYRERKKEALIGTSELCAYCGKPATTIDHIVPKDRGGADIPQNVVPCCGACNSSKRNRDIADFLNNSLHLQTQGIDHERVRSNEKLAAFVKWDEEKGCYVNVALRNADVTVQNKNKKEEIEEEKEIYKLYAPPQYDTDKVGYIRNRRAGENECVFEGVNGGERHLDGIGGACEAESRGTADGAGADGAGLRASETGPPDWRELSKGRLH